ncbi:unnamed protein product [Staurois parvus]|uniref:Uncharacterized protein n=1 Tax=Staurois parvus TaxID=386267 RepID=A0ABN9BL93_9NEOB|nr:unnamed protein product [Staurois parvus]
MGPRTASSCCCQARNLSWALYRPPHAAARSRVCHGSLYGLPLLLSPSPHSAMCHFQVSSHCWWVPFCHRVLYGLPLLLPWATATLWPGPHSGFGPIVTAQMSEVCGDSKIDGTHLHVILTDSIISLSPSRLQGHLN